jgi:hypothetical protein
VTDGATATTEPTPAPTSARDAAALTQLYAVAATSAAVDGEVSRVECWMPSEHMVHGANSTSIFKVICRVHYTQKSIARYKDMRCIGDFEATPMLSTCYRWAYHSLQPRFEDGPSLASPSPSPTP